MDKVITPASRCQIKLSCFNRLLMRRLVSSSAFCMVIFWRCRSMANFCSLEAILSFRFSAFSKATNAAKVLPSSSINIDWSVQMSLSVESRPLRKAPFNANWL